MTDKMLAEIDGTIGWMTFNNPAKHNAVSMDMWAAIPGILDAFVKDNAVKVVIVKGAGEKSFIAGADISEFEKNRNSVEATQEYDRVGKAAQDALYNCPKPTIAMIDGYCIGGGVSVAMSLDLRIASDRSKFGVPAAKLSVGYGAHGVKKLMDVVGPSYTKEIFYTARQFSADEALGMNWINRVLPANELEAYVRDYAATISQNAPLTIGALKKTVNALCEDSEVRDMAAVQAAVEACFGSEDYIEGRRAFMEKRKPAFQGR